MTPEQLAEIEARAASDYLVPERVGGPKGTVTVGQMRADIAALLADVRRGNAEVRALRGSIRTALNDLSDGDETSAYQILKVMVEAE